MPALNPLKPSWLAYRGIKPDFITVKLTKGEMHAYYIALVTGYLLGLRDGELRLR